MQYIDKAALVAEIERRIDEINQLGEKASYEVGLVDAYKIILSFLDTLEVKEIQEEPISKDLEEAAIQYAKSKHEDKVLQQIVSWDFKAGAQWQKEQMIDKAFKYINYQLNLPNDFEQHFRKAMEE